MKLAYVILKMDLEENSVEVFDIVSTDDKTIGRLLVSLQDEADKSGEVRLQYYLSPLMKIREI